MPHPHHRTVDSEGNETLVVIPLGYTPIIVNGDHPKFEEIVAAASDGTTPEEIEELADQTVAIAERFQHLSERVSVANGRVYFDGDEVHSSVASHIITCVESDLDLWPEAEVNFMEKVAANPEEHSREQLYDWLTAEGFTILPDGDLIGYKGVHDYSGDEDYTYQSGSQGTAISDGQVFNGHIPQNLGSVVEMPRSSVQHDPSSSCSTGLHVGTYGYARGFASSPENVLKVAVNPRDVVSVPTHAGGEKIRVSRYRVLEVAAFREEAPVSSYCDEDDLPEEAETSDGLDECEYCGSSDLDDVDSDGDQYCNGCYDYNWNVLA